MPHERTLREVTVGASEDAPEEETAGLDKEQLLYVVEDFSPIVILRRRKPWEKSIYFLGISSSSHCWFLCTLNPKP